MYAAAIKLLGRPFAGLAPERRKQLGLLALAIAFALFPILHDNDADIDSMANAAAYATHG